MRLVISTVHPTNPTQKNHHPNKLTLKNQDP